MNPNDVPNLTAKQALFLSSVAMLALADWLEDQKRDSITVQELRDRSHAEIAYFKTL